MKSFILCVLLFLSVEGRNRWSGSKDGPYDVGKYLDYFLEDVNSKIDKTSYKLNDFLIANATGRNVVLSELNTLVRTGQATVANHDTVFIVNAALGLKVAKIDVGKFTYKNVSAPAVFNIGKNSFRIAYSVDIANKINCTLQWQSFQIQNLDQVTVESSDPAFNNADVSNFFNTQVKQQLNKHFATDGFLKFLDNTINPCKHMYDNALQQLNSIIYAC